MRTPIRLAAPLALCLSAAAPPGPARADEGMWMPRQIPDLAPRLRELGFEGDPKAFAELTGKPLGAVVDLAGCSAAFVSPDGLIATNHHCIQRTLQYLSTPKRNLLEDGYVARTRADEPWNGPGSRIYVTVSFKDVTSAVTGGIDPKLSDLERGRLIEKRAKQEVARCERAGVRCSVDAFFRGAAYYAIGQLEIQDVRLVYAPHNDVGNFGGEVDNWMWPRHTGDFALYRAYVGRDGRPAPFSKDNVPYRPSRHLAVSSDGASEGDLVLVAGYPGKTHRLETADEVRHHLEWSYPRTVGRYRENLAILADLAKGSPETAIKVSSLVRGYANTMKNREAVVALARRDRILERKVASEKELEAWIAADPKRVAEYGGAVAAIAAVQRTLEQTRDRDAAFLALHLASKPPVNAARPLSLLSAARTLVRLAGERTRRDVDRDPQFQQRNWERIREGMERLDAALDVRADRALLRRAVREAAALPAGQRIPPLDLAAGLEPGLAPAEADARIDAWLERLYAGTRLHERAFRVSLVGRSAKQLALVDDTFLKLAAALAPFERQLADEAYARDGARSRHGPRYARALLEKAGGLLSPDANSTLRVTYGRVRGVSPRDGLVHLPQTTLSGVLEKHRPGDPDFDVPEAVRAAIARQQARKDGPLVDPKLGDVPVNFLSDVDITGGNSGSAVLNARGELVGLMFDGTYDSITSDFAFDPVRTRSIAVDSRYLLWSLLEVARAPHLVDELGGVRRASASAR